MLNMIHLKILIIIGILLAGYSYFIEPNKLEVTNYTIQDKELSGVKIVFASDFHIKPYGQKRLEKVVETINEEAFYYCDKLVELNIPAEKKMILDFEPIKTTGDYKVTIQFMKEVKCEIKVQVVEAK